MRGLLEELTVTALCAALVLQSSGTIDRAHLVALLCTLCCVGLGVWLSSIHPRWSGVPGVLLSAAALASAAFAAMLPVAAYQAAAFLADASGDDGATVAGDAGVTGDAGISPMPSGGDGLTHIVPANAFRRWIVAVQEWAWLVALAAAVVFGERDMASPIIVLFCGMAFAWGYASRRYAAVSRRLRRVEDERRDGLRRLRARLADSDEARAAAMHTATLEERTRIARDIHDHVGHLLTRAIMQTEAARVVADLRGDTAAARQFAGIAATVNEAMTMVRRTVHDLDDAGTDFPARIADAVQDSGTLHVTLRNGIDSVPASVARCCVAVIREALSNTARHSPATEAAVTLLDFPAFWQLVVQDNGGAVPHAGSASADGRPSRASMRGMGLADIESRVHALNGTCTFGPHGPGWRVFVSIPKKNWTEPPAAADPSRKETTV